MEPSAVRVTGPISTSLQGDRRRRIRHKLHTPVYASFNGPQTGMVVDLSELLDLNEDGFCVRTSPESATVAGGESDSANGLEVNHLVKLSLDLPETNNYIHGSGLVVWRDDGGRTGIRFSFLTERAAAALKEWLFVNMLVGCSHHVARSAQLAHYREEEAHAASSTPTPTLITFPNDRGDAERGLALSELDDARREVHELDLQDIETGQDSTETILQLLTERAMNLTGASGAALALLTDGKMKCRARAGDPAPPLGLEVDVREGLSGECARTGRTALCEDPENDPRVDAELCLAMGIGSFVVTPIVSDFRVVGLLEVFSPVVARFSPDETAVLELLAELVPKGDKKALRTDDAIVGETRGSFNRVCDVAAEEPTVPEGAATPVAEASAPIVAMTDVEERHEEPRVEIAATPTAVATEVPVAAAEEKAVSAEPDAPPKQVTGLDDLRAALWDRGPELEQQEQAERLQQQTASAESEPGAEKRPHMFQVGLILASVAAAALALGYLLAPTIERRLNGAARVAQSSPAPVSSQANKARAVTPDDLRKLAEQGEAEAQFMLGTLYRNGDGVLQNDKQAVEWFQRAADQGYVRALSALGSSYWAGRGVHQDYAQAYFWYQLALAEGDPNSKSLLEGIATQLTREQVASIRQQAEAWLHTHNQTAKSAN